MFAEDTGDVRPDPYVQCELKKDNRTQIAWIPEKFATPGQVLRVKDRGTWEDGWLVAHTFQRVERPLNLERTRRVFAKKLK